ncbi:hypothetical protein D3C81_2164220 [compost metagenome]
MHGFRGTALGLLDEEHEHREHQARHRRDEKWRAPAVERLDHPADGKERQQ